MSQYPEARFLLSAGSPTQFLPDEGAEVAFVGRSNAGKSSAINAIVNRKQFARTSKTPGRTQLVNFFQLASGQRLVDLPGYGFARVSDKMRNDWARLITGYFDGRQCVQGLFLVVDVRRGLTEGDFQVLEMAESYGFALHLLLTKSDKLKRGQAIRAMAEAQRLAGESATVQLFSATKRTGLEEARIALSAMLGGKSPAG